MYQRTAMLVTLHCDNSQFLCDGGFHKGAAIWLAPGPPSSDGFGLRRLCWLFVSLRTGHRADFWLNPPHCDEWRGVGGWNSSPFCCRSSSLCKIFLLHFIKKEKKSRWWSNFNIRRTKSRRRCWESSRKKALTSLIHLFRKSRIRKPFDHNFSKWSQNIKYVRYSPCVYISQTFISFFQGLLQIAVNVRNQMWTSKK